jgi:hypothetical protein
MGPRGPVAVTTQTPVAKPPSAWRSGRVSVGKIGFVSTSFDLERVVPLSNRNALLTLSRHQGISISKA